MVELLQTNDAAPMAPEVVQVRAFHRENHDTYTLELAPPKGSWGGAGGFAFQPGQFNMLYCFAVGEAAISLSGDPENRQSIIHTIRAVGSVTKMMEKLAAGDWLGIRGPFGSSWPLVDAKGNDIVLVTGGIGLAPLRPAIHDLLNNRSDYGRIILLHGARLPDDLIYKDEIRQWQSRNDFEVFVTVDSPNTSWKGPIGMVTSLFPRIQLDPQRTIGLLCGPEIMMRFALKEFHKRGVGDDRLFVSLERNMQCAVGFCGHCQFGPSFVCMDGPVFRYDRIRDFFGIRDA